MKLFRICKEFFNKLLSNEILIPLSVEDKETLVRCIGHDLYYSSSKKRLASTAFMPPSGSNEVSLLRLEYTNADSCKEHAKSIKKNNYTYCGLSITKAVEIKTASEKCKNAPLYFSNGILVV